MTIDLSTTLERGGSNMVQLLSYCVYCRKFDPVFVFLVRNFQLLPNSVKAVVLFDEFISNSAPLPLSIPGTDHSLVQSINKIKGYSQFQHEPAEPASNLECEDASAVFAPYLPPKFLFDSVLSAITTNGEQSQSIEREYNLSKSAVENLPDGKLSGTHFQYLEHVWKPARQRLTLAGFTMVANICG